MRKLCLVGLAVGMFACGGGDAAAPPPQPPPAPAPVADMPPPPAATADAPAAPPPSQTDKDGATMQAWKKAMDAHDYDALAATYTPDAVFKFAGMPDKTRDEMIAHEKENAASFPDAKGAARRVFMKNDVAVVEWTMTGTNTGPGPHGAKSTGKAIGVNGATIFWFTPDGLIKEQHEYIDVPTMIGQLGMGPKTMKVRAPATLPDGAPEIHVSKNTPDEDKNSAAMTAVQKMFETHDAKSFADTSTDDVMWDSVSRPAPMNGKKEMVKYFDAITKSIPDMKMDCTNWAIDNFVIDECTMSGTNKAPFMGMKVAATNKPITIHSVDVIQIKDGKAVSGTSYQNGMEVAEQLGLMKHEMGDHAKAADAKAGAKPAKSAKPTK